MSYPAIAILDYIPQEIDSSDYLSFQKDDELVIATFYENGWCFGSKASNPSESGFIPLNHIYISHPEEKQEEPPKVTHKFIPTPNPPEKLSMKTK